MNKFLLLNLFNILFFLPSSLYAGSYEVEQDLMTDKKEIMFSISSETTYKDSINQDREGLLFIRCSPEKVDLIINTFIYNGRNKEITLRWGTDEPFTERWTQDSRGIAFFNRKDPNKFISKLKENDSLTVQWKPYQSRPQAMKFDLNDQNFKEDIKQAEKDGCNFSF